MRALLAGLCLSSLISLAAPPRDPFAKPVDLEPPSPIAICNTSLCRHELNDLELVAIVAQGPESVAMFQNAQGQGFLARRNVQVGQGGARITAIERECVTLTRLASQSAGNVTPVRERVCIASPAQPSDHDYLRDGPY